MRHAFVIVFACCVWVFSLHGAVDPVVVDVPNPKAWKGQRLPFTVELRARGTFSGTAGFDLPQVPGALVIKIGEPVVGTQKLEGETWFVQKHEFALFSQRTGELIIPPFSVRFASRDGYTGPASDVQSQTPPVAFEILRPPDSDRAGFLVTTEELEITETWEPTPGPAEVGAIFKRTIIQSAEQLPGMAFAPASTVVPDGMRVYPVEAETDDDFYRGAFRGERRETITYLIQKPGTLELPPLTYTWWNPELEMLQSKTLAAASFEVPFPIVEAETDNPLWAKRVTLWVLAVLAGLASWKRQQIRRWIRLGLKKMNPPDIVAARKLLRASSRNDAATTASAWTQWRGTQPASFRPSAELQPALLELQRHLFGPATAEPWHGENFSRAFRQQLATPSIRSSRETQSVLPVLNPRS
jgi:hypothetical protein